MPNELLQAVSQFSCCNPPTKSAKLLALELFRAEKVSLGSAAELCQTPIEAFMEFAAEHGVPLHYGVAELEEDRRALAKLRA